MAGSLVRTSVRIGIAAASFSLASAAPGWSELSALIPRETLFGNPEKDQARISPDGKRLSWIAPDAKNVLQVWVRTLGLSDDKRVTADPKRGIRVHHWAPDGRTILYLQDSDGDETWPTA